MIIAPLTAQQVHIIAAKLKHARWVTDECPGCDYKIGYLFDADKVTYDPGCRCEGCYNPPMNSSWETVAADINTRLQSSEAEAIKLYWNLC